MVKRDSPTHDKPQSSVEQRSLHRNADSHKHTHQNNCGICVNEEIEELHNKIQRP